MTRARLEFGVRQFAPSERIDADITDRALAVRLLSALGVDVDTKRASDGQPLRHRADAYLVEYACLTAEEAYCTGSGGVDFHERQRRLRVDQQKHLARISRAPLSGAPPWTEEELARPEWQRPLPNSREMQGRRR